MNIYDAYNGNKIGGSGGRAIGEGLKFNSTLTKLSLWNEELIIYNWEFHDDMINLCFLMYIMGII